VAIGDGDTRIVLAGGLDQPVHVAFDAHGRCHVSDERLGAVLRFEEDGEAGVVVDGSERLRGSRSGRTVRRCAEFTPDVVPVEPSLPPHQQRQTSRGPGLGALG
jgi:hypothetical protein